MQPDKNSNRRFSPFLDAAYPIVGESSNLSIPENHIENTSSRQMHESPFQQAEAFEGVSMSSAPITDEFISFTAEMWEPEFDEEIYALINELTRSHERQISYEGHATASGEIQTQMLQLQIDPLNLDIENWIDRLAARLEQEDIGMLEDQVLESIFEELEVDESSYTPQPDEFFKKLRRRVQKKVKSVGRRIKGKIKKTVKKVVQKAKSTVKKAGRAIKKISGKVWNKLKRIARSLLKRIIKVAINRLPVALQPIARKLAKRFVKEVEEEIYLFKGQPQPGSTISMIQKEFDAQLAVMTLTNNELEQEQAIAEYESETDATADNALANLDQARMKFVYHINALDENEDPAPAIEEFVPAVLAGLKLGIRIIGRRRVVRFIAKYIAKLIRRWVGKKWAKPLSRAIVDLGMRLARLETEEEKILLAGEAVASTVEETIRKVAELDDYILDNEALLEGFVIDAFENAASSNLPPVLSEKVYQKHPRLRQSSRLKGVWIMHPRHRGKHRRIKIYSRRIRREITPHMADMVRSWHGPLSMFIKKRYGIYGRPVRTLIRTYEAIPGTVLGLIGEYQNEVHSMEQASAESFHPLTMEAAGVLLDEPGLGRDVNPEFLAEPHHIAVGQRFYYLELIDEPETMAMLPLSNDLKRCCETHLVLDFLQRQVRISVFIEEENALDLAQKIERGIRPGVVLANLRSVYARGIRYSLSTGADHQTKIIHRAVMPIQMTSDQFMWIPPAFLAMFERKLIEALDQGFLEKMPKVNSQFVAAAHSPALGLTLVISINNPPGMQSLDQLIGGEPTQLPRVGLDAPSPESVTFKIKTGFWRG